MTSLSPQGDEPAVTVETDGVARPTPVLELNGVDAGYGAIPVLREVTLSVGAGEVVALLGANGAGKTTTMLTVAGVLRPTAGSVMFLGRPMDSSLHARAREGLAFVPAERSVIRSLTALENLRIGRGPVERALELFPSLRPLLNRKAGLLSGGEQQILVLARALASSPKLIAADEISLGLAPMIVRSLLAALREAARGGAAVLLVEQQVGNALDSADWAYVMRRGRVAMAGTAASMKSRLSEIEASYLAEGAQSA